MKLNSAKSIAIVFVALMALFLVSMACAPMPGDGPPRRDRIKEATRMDGSLIHRNYIHVTEFPEYGLVCFTYNGIDCHPLQVE